MKHGLGLILLLSILFFSCKRKYIVKDNKVYCSYWIEGNKSEFLVDSADAKTFKSIDLKCDCDFSFGKDINFLFIDGLRVNGIDPNSFSFIGNYIFRDKNSAYFFGFYNNLDDCRIDSVKPDKIELLKYPWAKADNKLIWGKQTLSLDDINDFKPIDDDWGKTKTKIINDGEILKGVDYNTFQIINSSSAKDKYHKFEYGKMIE
jgi:hypothetical protein